VRITELHLEQFKKEGVDYDIKHAKTRWRELLADLRFLGNSGYPRLVKGEKWSNWDMDSLLSYFGAIVDALRSVYFPFIPPSKDDPRYNTSYWKAYRKAEEKGYIKSKPPKPEEISEWDKKRKDIIKTSLEEAERKIDGLYLTYPHGELFWTKEKTLLVKTRKFDLSKPHYLIDDGLCYGIISFKEPKRITKKQFFTEDLKKKHRILDTEAWQWWRMSRDNAVEPELWAYEVKKFEPFEIPERVKIPKGIQVIVDADNIEFVGEDEEKPARIDWPTMATKEAKTDYIKFYGTKGYIEEENDEHKYHTCILLSLNDTNILLDYGERHPKEIEERIDVILNSHCHIDHICPEISNFVCSIYVSKQTLNRVDFSLPEDIRIYEARKAFNIGNIKITTYPVYHSIRAPMHIFKIETDGLAIGVMTDFLGFRDKEDEASFYPNLDIVIIDGSSITKDLRRWKEDHNLIFGHESVVHQIKRIRDKCEKNPIVILTHIGREGIEWGDPQILQYLHERFPDIQIYIAKDGSVFDLKTRRFTEAFKGEQICKDIVANLPSFTWIPEFTSITGSTLFTKDHAPRDLDIMCKAEEINGKWYIPVDTSLLLKLQRAYQYATKKVLGKAIKPEFPPPALIGANWSSIPAYDLKLVPRKNPEVRRTGEEEFEEKVYGVDFKEGVRPPFGMPAGKNYLASQIIPYISPHKIYVEPFCGSAAIFFKKSKAEESVLSDKNPEIVFALKYIRDNDPEHIRKAVDNYDWILTKERWERSLEYNIKDPDKRFCNFLYSVRGSFSNNRQDFRPSLQGKSIKPKLIGLENQHEMLQGVTILNKDALKVISEYDSPDTFFYIDPPYLESDALPSKERFGEEQWQQLSNLLKKIKGKFILSTDKAGLKYFDKFETKTIKRTSYFQKTNQSGKFDTYNEYIIANFPLKKQKLQEKLRLRTKSKDIEKMAQQSLKEDKIKPLRFFMPLKPIRVQGKHGERNTPERLVELFEPEHYPVYNSVKRDGFRVQIHADGDKVVIYSEDGNDITKQLPTIVDAVKKLKAKSVVLDAECELWEDGYHHPREAAIAKIHSKAIDDKDLIANLFDCVYLNGEDLHKEPFEERWKALNSIGIKYSKETNLNPEEKLNIIPHILCKTPKELLRETERMRKVKSSEGCVAIAHNAIYPLDGKPDDNSFCKFHNNVVVRGIVIEPVQTKVSTVYNLSFGCLAGKHEILKKDQTEVGPYEEVLTIGSTFAAPYVKRGSIIEVECETINHIIHEDIEGKPIEITAWAPRFMRVVPGAKHR